MNIGNGGFSAFSDSHTLARLRAWCHQQQPHLLKDLNCCCHQYPATATNEKVMAITFSRYFDGGRILRMQVQDWRWLPALE